MLHSRQEDGRSTLCLELAGPLGCDDVRESAKVWRTATCVAGNGALAIDLSLLTGIDGAGRRSLSRSHASEMRFVASCERPGTLPESIAGISAASMPAICEPFGIWAPVKNNSGRRRLRLNWLARFAHCGPSPSKKSEAQHPDHRAN
jgi:hypothetical protein